MYNERRRNRRMEAAAAQNAPSAGNPPRYAQPSTPAPYHQYSGQERRQHGPRNYDRGSRRNEFSYNNPEMNRRPEEFGSPYEWRENRGRNDYRDRGYREPRDPRSNADYSSRNYNDDYYGRNKRARYGNDRFKGGERMRTKVTIVPLESLRPKDSRWDLCADRFTGMSAKFAKTMGLFSAAGKTLKELDDETIQGLIAKQNALLEAHQNWIQVEEAILGLSETHSSKFVILKDIDVEKYSSEVVTKYLEGFLASVVIPNVSYEDLSLNVEIREQKIRKNEENVQLTDTKENQKVDRKEVDGKEGGENDDAPKNEQDGSEKEFEMEKVKEADDEKTTQTENEEKKDYQNESASANKQKSEEYESEEITLAEDFEVSRHFVVECLNSVVATTLLSLNNKEIPELGGKLRIIRPNSYISNAKPIKQTIKANNTETGNEDAKLESTDTVIEEIVESAHLICTNNLSEEVTSDEIMGMLSKYGKLHSLTLLIDKRTYDCNGTAFFSFQDFSDENKTIEAVIQSINDDLKWNCFRPCVNETNDYFQKVTITKYNIRDYVDMKNTDVTRQKVSNTIQFFNSISAAELVDNDKYEMVLTSFKTVLSQFKGFSGLVLLRPSPETKNNAEELHPEYGKILVKFANINDAKICLNNVCGRYFRGRLILGGYADEADYQEFFP